MPSVRGRRGITVVIAFRGKAYLGRLENCLRSLVRQSVPPTEIIVSEQDEAGVAGNICEEVGATHLLTKKRPMFNKSAALNVGIKNSKTRHVYTLDADVILGPYALERSQRAVSRGWFVMLDAYRGYVEGSCSWDQARGRCWSVDWSRTCFGLLNATTRKRWFELRGFDEKFVGWGFEDTYVVWKAEFKKFPIAWLRGQGVHQEHDVSKEYRDRVEGNKKLFDKRKRSPWPASWGNEQPVLCTSRTPVSSLDWDDFCFLITSYNRPHHLARLLGDIDKVSGDKEVRVRVFDDGSEEEFNYSWVVRWLKRRKGTYLRAKENHGKIQYWSWIDQIMKRVRGWRRSRYYIKLDDDVRLCDGFLDEAVSRWNSIDDLSCVVMNPLKDHIRERIPSWGGESVQIGPLVDRTGWVDMMWFCEQDFFEELDWSVSPIDTTSDPSRSSGVGLQITYRLRERDRTMYRSSDSLVVHELGKSYMNPEVRERELMTPVSFVGGEDRSRRLEAQGLVCASLATIPSRASSLRATVRSLLPQIHRLHVYLNGYDHIPDFLDHPKIILARSQDHGDNGDAGKFWWSDKVVGYHLICDDDLIYPTDYVPVMVNSVKNTGGKAAVGLHGVLIREPVDSYYGSRDVHHFNTDLEEPVLVHILATNSLCYHTSAIKVSPSDFPVGNMADVWFGVLGQAQEVPFLCLPHSGGWLQDITPDHQDSIYWHSKKGSQTSKNTAEVQTAVVRGQAPWKVYEVR